MMLKRRPRLKSIWTSLSTTRVIKFFSPKAETPKRPTRSSIPRKMKAKIRMHCEMLEYIFTDPLCPLVLSEFRA